MREGKFCPGSNFFSLSPAFFPPTVMFAYGSCSLHSVGQILVIFCCLVYNTLEGKTLVSHLHGNDKEKGTLLHCWWECKLVQPLWRTVWRSLKKLEIELLMTQQSNCWAYTPRKPELKETHVPQCLLQHCLQ